MNPYEHLIAFEKLTDDTSFYKPSKTHDALQAKPGDSWRWLAPQSVTFGNAEKNVRLALISPRYRESCGDEWQTNAIRYIIGGVRRQECEKYVEITLRVGDLPTSGLWKQFALTRANGQTVLGTFKGQQTEKAAYMQALADYYESYPYTKVLCEINGSTLNVRIYEKQGVFALADEGLKIGLGFRSTTNTNEPRLDRAYLGPYTYPAQDSYAVTIGSSVQTGNKFTLGSTVYVAVPGDDAAAVKAALLGTAERYKIPTVTIVTAKAEAGVRRIQNGNLLSVQAVFDSVDGGSDLYHIRIDGTPAAGNLIQVTADGKPTRSYTVLAGDTVETIEAAFNTDSTYYEVDNGVIPQGSFIAGFQDAANQNRPSLQLSDLQQIASYTVERWQILIGSDVQAGNEYYLGDVSYTAQENDDENDVAAGLGQEAVSFTIETAEGVTPSVYASAGYAYGPANLADVTITDGPKLVRASQVVVEAEFPCDMQPGEYRLGIVDDLAVPPILLGMGNYVHVTPNARGEIVECADSGDAYGYEYYERGLSQRLRLGVWVDPPTQKTQSDRVVGERGGYRTTTTRIEYESMLVTVRGRDAFHSLLAAMLKHEIVKIGGKTYQLPGEYEESTISKGTDLRQAKATILEVDREKNNLSGYRSSDYQSGEYGGFCKLSVQSGTAGLALWIRNGQLVRQLNESDHLINTGSYQLTVNPFDDVTLSIYRNGTLYLTAHLPKNERVRLSQWLRLATGQSWHLVFRLSDTCVSEPIISYFCEEVSDPEITYECERIQKPDYGEYAVDFSNDFTI